MVFGVDGSIVAGVIGLVSGSAAGLGGAKVAVKRNTEEIDKLKEHKDESIDRLARMETKIDLLIERT